MSRPFLRHITNSTMLAARALSRSTALNAKWAQRCFMSTESIGTFDNIIAEKRDGGVGESGGEQLERARAHGHH